MAYSAYAPSDPIPAAILAQKRLLPRNAAVQTTAAPARPTSDVPTGDAGDLLLAHLTTMLKAIPNRNRLLKTVWTRAVIRSMVLMSPVLPE